MKFLLLAVLLLAVSQSPRPTPAPTPDKTAPTQQGTQAPNNSSPSPASESQHASDKSTTKSDESSGTTTKPDVSLTPVEVSKFPPVSVTKGWTDYTYWFFGLLLVVVGFLQVRLLSKTLGAISDQADTMEVQAQTMKEQAQIMEQQSKTAEEAAKAATLNAKAALENIEMFISKERARLRVEIDRLKLEPRFSNVYAVDLKVFIHGTTPAFITDAQCVASWTPAAHINDTDYVPIMYGMRLPNPIAPNSDPIEDFSIWEDQSGEMLNEIKLDRAFITVWGFIKYKDVFDRDRETRFRRVWKFSEVIPVDAEYRPGKWEKCGSEEDNKET